MIDLHTHTIASDGSLPPGELLQHARTMGISMLAVTDHDTLAAYDDPEMNTNGTPLVITGIELSARWRRHEIHILGLNIDPLNPVLRAGISRQQQSREQRAEHIAERLGKLGLNVSLAQVKSKTGGNSIGRLHFARYMVENGFVKDLKTAFRKYLSPGKPAYQLHAWPMLPEIVSWIHTAGGQSVLAHPDRYGMTHTGLQELVTEFRQAGGQALEVVSGRQLPAVTRRLTGLSRQHQLLASCGSDFHHPGQPWSELGRFPRLPAECTPVWTRWQKK